MGGSCDGLSEDVVGICPDIEAGSQMYLPNARPERERYISMVSGDAVHTEGTGRPSVLVWVE